MTTNIRKFKNIDELNASAAELFVQTAARAIADKGRFTVALTGGSSPIGLYRLLTRLPFREQVDWRRVYVFWGDERWVPLSDDRSNAKMSYETLLNHVPIPADQVFPMWSANVEAVEYAREYEDLLKQYLGTEGRFDLILLGMGADGHTASWFPGTEVLEERLKWVRAYYLAPQEMYRITLTVPVVNRANRVAVITYGEGKAEALYQVLEGLPDPVKDPAHLLSGADNEVTWFVDEAAASKLS